MPNILKDIPKEIRTAILIKQAELKVAKNNRLLSQKQTIVQIVKEWMELKNPKPTA